jgi:hypothetical protein
MLMKWTRFGMLALLAGTVGVVGCAESTGPSNGRLVVRLTDAPFPYSEVDRVDVYVVRVDARRTAVGDAEAENAGNMNGWTTVAETNAAFNLLDLQGGKTANLGSTTLATGTYSGFRLIIDPQLSSVTLKDGTVLNGSSNPGITFPSAHRTGIKINLDSPISVVADSSVMIVDFDVGRSFVLRGNSIRNNGLIFKPVLRATAQELTGSISGSVRALANDGAVVAGASVELLKQGTALADTDETNVVATTSTDLSGNFRFGFILPGTYEIRVTAPGGSPLKAALLAGGVTVTSGTETANVLVVLHE